MMTDDGTPPPPFLPVFPEKPCVTLELQWIANSSTDRDSLMSIKPCITVKGWLFACTYAYREQLLCAKAKNPTTSEQYFCWWLYVYIRGICAADKACNNSTIDDLCNWPYNRYKKCHWLYHLTLKRAFDFLKLWKVLHVHKEIDEYTLAFT